MSKAEETRIPLATQIVHGENSFRAVARLAVTNRGKNAQGTALMIGGIIASPEVPESSSNSGYDIWECEIIIIPRKKWKNEEFAGRGFAGYRIDQVLTSGVLADPDKHIEDGIIDG